jgi:hypothetical protein
MLSTRMETVAASRLSQRMQEQSALQWVPRHDKQLPHCEVLARLVLAPVGRSGLDRW